MVRRRFGALLGAALVSLTGMVAAVWPEAAEAEPEHAELREARAADHAARVAAFTAYLETKKALREAAEVTAFGQLSEMGLDGAGLKRAAAEAGLDLAEFGAFDLSSIQVAAVDEKQRNCLADAIYYEARNQSLAGQVAVADVVMNRVDSGHYPDTVCRVVYQGASRVTGCQFSFTCDGSMAARVERPSMIAARAVATAVLGGFRLPLTGGALNYHADYVDPYWAPTLQMTAVVGDHIFYRPGSGTPVRFAMLD